VAIVGAGYTGLWTAYYLAKADDHLRIAVIEKAIAGFGASGRNGGWVSPAFSVPAARVAKRYGRAAALALQQAMLAAVDEVGRVADAGRAAVGFAVGIVLYLALILAGSSIATAVATEKSTRISEVLLAVLKPSQLLVGTVLGVGLLALVQIAALAVPVIIGLISGSTLVVPAAAAGDIGLAVLWFVLGMMLYAFVFAALATLVEKPTEIGSATMPINALLIGSYLIAVTITVAYPNGLASVLASLFPLSAPLVMPIRWASGLVPPWQLALSMTLVAASALLVAAFASRIYARGLARTGRRLKLREVLRD